VSGAPLESISEFENAAAHDACAPEAFERRYVAAEDPWGFRNSPYELRRYAATLSALPQRKCSFAYEPACSIGELTARLAPRCDRVLATDVSPTAVRRARERCAAFQHVRVACGDVRTTVLDTAPDLIVLSEVAYYFSIAQLEHLAEQLGNALRTGGTLIAVHWLGESPDHVLHGDVAHAVLLRTLPLRYQAYQRHSGFRLDVWKRP
jgi:SAM-dependent methyltransferase